VNTSAKLYEEIGGKELGEIKHGRIAAYGREGTAHRARKKLARTWSRPHGEMLRKEPLSSKLEDWGKSGGGGQNDGNRITEGVLNWCETIVLREQATGTSKPSFGRKLSWAVAGGDAWTREGSVPGNNSRVWG